MNELALFAGAGGGILGSILLGHRIVCAVELDPYCREILLRRQEDKILPPVPVWDDIRSFSGEPWRGLVDVMSAGFPCQPWSVAGKRQGQNDSRNLWPDTIRVIREVGPAIAFLENVPGLVRSDYFGQILGDLAEAGFDAGWDVVSAGEIGALHRRQRLWILAHTDRTGLEEPRQPFPETTEKPSTHRQGNNGQGWWLSEPDVGRVAHGVAHRLDRLKALGNGQVPRVAQVAW